MTQLKDGGRQPGNREERSLSASTVIARWQGNGEPCKSRGLRTVLWAAGGEIPPADPAAWNPLKQPVLATAVLYAVTMRGVPTIIFQRIASKVSGPHRGPSLMRSQKTLIRPLVAKSQGAGGGA